MSNFLRHAVLMMSCVTDHVHLYSLGGLILDCTVSQFKGFAIYSPVINGVGGNLVAVQASRLSTSLHQVGVPGDVPADPEHQYHGLLASFFSNGKVSCIVVLLVVLCT